eukprot:TRINITY_DN18998_c0_g1_i1.p1 TRINITY_DN18998_c0_g1~~TRINITY_DN18998_c0_g1_i1.p1  ORF type:complete len:251 (-),score=55.93 TRINITY_DN18998_c0_g1_i1:206-958(-)
MMSKLKKENYELRNERNELRKERDALQTQLNAAKEKVKKLEALGGDDEDLLKQLANARRDARQQRSQKRALQAEAIKLTGISNALRRKLTTLAKKVTKYDPEMGQRIMNQKDAKGMIDELATQYTDMISKYEAAQDEIKRLKKQIADLKKRHEEEMKDQKSKLKERKQVVKQREARIAELEDQLKDKKDELELMEESLRDAQEYHEKNKKYRQRNKDLQGEISQFEQMRETYQNQLNEDKTEKKRTSRNN